MIVFGESILAITLLATICLTRAVPHTTNACATQNFTASILRKHKPLDSGESKKFRSLQKLFHDSCDTSLQQLHVGHDQQLFGRKSLSFATNILIGVAESVGVNTFFASMKEGISTALTCLGCQILMNLLAIDLIGKDTMAYTFIEVCVLLRLSTQQVCHGIVNNFKDQVDYIRLNARLTPNEMCGVLMGVQCAVGSSNKLYWRINIPNRVSHKNAVAEMSDKTERRQPLHKIMHVTDIHVDPQYFEGTVTKCGEPLCCHLTNGFAVANGGAGEWGAFSCDIPYVTADNGLRQLKAEADRAGAHVWYWTGDVVAHDIWRYERNASLRVSRLMTDALQSLTNSKTRIIPAVGNHETVPVNSFPPPEITNEFDISWLYTGLADQWSQWLPQQALQTVKKFGSYSLQIRRGFRVIVINSNYCARLNIWTLYDSVDPAGHLSWLIGELLSAEQAGDRVHIVGHVPPDDRECTQAWLYNFLAVVERFRDTIVAQFYGHTHADEFRVLYSLSNFTQPIGFEILSPSLTTFSEYNPAFRIFTTDESGIIQEMDTYYFNLTRANRVANEGPVWLKEYSTKSLYAISDFTFVGWNNLVRMLAKNDLLFQTYYRLYYRQSEAMPSAYCGTACRTSLLADIVINNPYEINPKPIWSSG